MKCAKQEDALKLIAEKEAIDLARAEERYKAEREYLQRQREIAEKHAERRYLIQQGAIEARRAVVDSKNGTSKKKTRSAKKSRKR